MESEMNAGEFAEIRGSSNTSVEDAIKRGLAAVDKTIHNVRCLWMKEMKEHRVQAGKGSAPAYQVDMLVTFIADDWQPARS